MAVAGMISRKKANKPREWLSSTETTTGLLDLEAAIQAARKYKKAPRVWGSLCL